MTECERAAGRRLVSIVWIATQLYATQNTAAQTMPYKRMYQTRSTQAGT